MPPVERGTRAKPYAKAGRKASTATPSPASLRSAPSPAMRERGYNASHLKPLSRTAGEGGPSAQRLVGEGPQGSRRRRQREDMRRVGNVLQPLLAEIDKLGGDRAAHLPPRIGGDADAAGRGETLEARREIDAVAVNVVRRHDHVAEIDPDAELDAAVHRQPGVPRANAPLHIQSAAHRVDHTAELDESPVTGMFDDAAAVLADLRCDNLATIGQQADMGALLIGVHQAGIADDIGSQDRRQPAFEPQMIGPQALEQAGSLGHQPLHEDGPTSGHNSGDAGVAYLRPNFLQHDHTSLIAGPRRAQSGRKEKGPVRVRRGPGNRLSAQISSAQKRSFRPRTVSATSIREASFRHQNLRHSVHGRPSTRGWAFRQAEI